jgi:DNA-binding MarR family transcriptional regulator
MRRDIDHTGDARIPLAGLLEAASQAVFAEFRMRLAESGYDDIRPTHGCVFRFVRDEGMRLTELANFAGMAKQSVGEIVDNLVALGYVERVPDPSDQRAKLIRLTRRGSKAQATGFALFGELEDDWADQFGRERMAEARELLEQIVGEKLPQAVPELARPELAEPQPAGA